MPADGVLRKVALTAFDRFRPPNLVTTDVRLAKGFRVGSGSVLAGVDVFNLFNRATVLQRERDRNSPQANFVTEVLGPRVLQFGLRVRWR